MAWPPDTATAVQGSRAPKNVGRRRQSRRRPQVAARELVPSANVHPRTAPMRPVNLRNTSALLLAALPAETIGPAMDGPARGTTGLAVLAAAAVLVMAPAGQSAAPRHERGEDVRAREAWFYGQRAFPRTTIPRGAYLRARRRGAGLPQFPGPRPDRPAGKGRPRAGGAGFAWSPIGPRAIDTPGHDDAGRVTSLAIQNNQIVYAGSAGGGVWKTTDRGVHWSPVFDGKPSMAIGAVAIDPNNASTVYAGTGEANFSRGDSYYGAGLYKSPNAGRRGSASTARCSTTARSPRSWSSPATPRRSAWPSPARASAG